MIKFSELSNCFTVFVSSICKRFQIFKITILTISIVKNTGISWSSYFKCVIFKVFLRLMDKSICARIVSLVSHLRHWETKVSTWLFSPQKTSTAKMKQNLNFSVSVQSLYISLYLYSRKACKDKSYFHQAEEEKQVYGSLKFFSFFLNTTKVDLQIQLPPITVTAPQL